MNLSISEKKELVKNFLHPVHPYNSSIRYFPYNVMHEAGANEIEHYFVAIEKNDIKYDILHLFFDIYSKKHPLIDVSKITQRFIKQNEKDFYFILIGSISHHDPQFSQKAYSMMEDAHNIISIKMIGEPADFSNHMENKLDTYVEQVKDLSIEASQLAREKAKQHLLKGKEIFDEKAPILKKSLLDLGSKVSSKIKQISKNKLK